MNQITNKLVISDKRLIIVTVFFFSPLSPNFFVGANPISSQISQSFRNAHLDRKADTSLCKHHNLSIVYVFLFFLPSLLLILSFFSHTKLCFCHFSSLIGSKTTLFLHVKFLFSRMFCSFHFLFALWQHNSIFQPLTFISFDKDWTISCEA